jgi:hypothetical protein
MSGMNQETIHHRDTEKQHGTMNTEHGTERQSRFGVRWQGAAAFVSRQDRRTGQGRDHDADAQFHSATNTKAAAAPPHSKATALLALDA